MDLSDEETNHPFTSFEDTNAKKRTLEDTDLPNPQRKRNEDSNSIIDSDSQSQMSQIGSQIPNSTRGTLIDESNPEITILPNSQTQEILRGGFNMNEINPKLEDTLERIQESLEALEIEIGGVKVTGKSYSSQYLLNTITILQTILLCDIFIEISPKGSGKSTMIVESIWHLIKGISITLSCGSLLNIPANPKLRVLVISPRITFSRFMCQLINKMLILNSILDDVGNPLRVIHYKDIPVTTRYLGETQFLSIQLDSILRLFSDAGGFIPYDYLILDEIKSILRYFSCTNIKEQRDLLFKAFEIIIKTSKNVIMSDCDFDQSSLNVVHSIVKDSDKHISISMNKFKNDKRGYKVLSSKGQLLTKLLDFLGQGFRIIFPTNSKMFSKQIKLLVTEKFPNKKVLVINSDLTNDNGDLAYDTSTWVRDEYDLVIYTGRITCGISFDDPNYFHYCFACFVVGSNPAPECVQMIQRCRHLIKNMVYICLPKESAGNTSISDEALDELIGERFDQVQEMINSNPSSGFEKYLNRQDKQEFLDNAYNLTWKANKTELRNSYKNLRGEILKVIAKYVVDVNQIEIVPLDKNKIKMGELKKRITKEESELIANAELIIDKAVIERLSKNENKTLDDVYKIKRYWFNRNFNQNPANVDFISEWGNCYYMISNFETIFFKTDIIVRNEDVRLLDMSTGENILHLCFASDQKTIMSRLLVLLKMDITKPWEYVLNLSDRFDFVEINKLLKTMIMKDQKKVLPSIVGEKTLLNLTKKILNFLGLRLKRSNRKSETGSTYVVYNIDNVRMMRVLHILIEKYRDQFLVTQQIYNFSRVIFEYESNREEEEE